MTKYRVQREMDVGEFQIVEASNEDEAIRIAGTNPEGFQEMIGNETEWNYSVWKCTVDKKNN